MARCLPAVNGLYRGRRAYQQLGLYGFTALRTVIHLALNLTVQRHKTRQIGFFFTDRAGGAVDNIAAHCGRAVPQIIRGPTHGAVFAVLAGKPVTLSTGRHSLPG